MQLAFGQERWLIGIGATYCSDLDSPGLNANVTYRLMGNLHIGPDVSALLSREVNENGRLIKQKELEYNFNAHQIFELNNRFAIYPLAGLNISRVVHHPEGASKQITFTSGFNVGGGVECKVKHIRIFLESKYVVNFPKVDVTSGVMLML
jgi:hypothetical protein